jgi:hypothetical protein
MRLAYLYTFRIVIPVPCSRVRALTERGSARRHQDMALALIQAQVVVRTRCTRGHGTVAHDIREGIPPGRVVGTLLRLAVKGDQ